MENYEIITHEKMYINQEATLVTVSFQLPYHDWLLIEESNEWSQIEKLLGELRNKRSQKSHPRKRESEDSDNFCQNCGKKLNETCKRCWVLKKDNYNCGESSCPGYGLYRILKSK